ncbi:MAG TPA: hypothetical protein VK483_12300 [Chitinophagaceae bacterium]|nr:hypothetical protein [Chitinophagaceae bacterium]
MDGIISKILEELGFEVSIQPGANRQGCTFYLKQEWQDVGSFEVSNKVLFTEEIDSKFYEKLKNLFYNETLPKEKPLNDLNDLYEFIEANHPVTSPQDKANRVLSFLRRLSNYDGEYISTYEFFDEANRNWRYMYLTDWSEFSFYLDYLIDTGFLAEEETEGRTSAVKLTVEGLKRIVEINEISLGKTCFIAMSFDDEMLKVYNEAIKPAIIETGFEPLIIDEKGDIPSDTTINDAILAAIKKSKFTIADFTNHKHGVYFESAYALGRGQKIIYTCRQDEIAKAHFDTRNYPHIVWKDAEDLKKQLIDKIEVFIKG